MARRIITNPKFIVERDGNDYVLKFRQGNIYKPIEFNNAQFSGKKNMVISQPNFSIIDDKLFVNINGHDVKIGEVGDGYTLANKLKRNTIVEPNLDVVITQNGGASVVTEINGKNITINGGGLPPAPPNSILYTVVEGGHKPESTWITQNCSQNLFDENTGEGYLVLKDTVTSLDGEYIEEPEEVQYTIFKDYSGEDWVDNNVTSVIIPEQITSVGDDTFNDYLSLVSVELPNNLTRLGVSAFSGSGLNSINIPNTVLEIDDACFSSCANLTSIVIPNSITIINESTFSMCVGLISVEIPEGVQQINNGAFMDCSGLHEVVIPSTVEKIMGKTGTGMLPTGAFSKCSNLASITCLAQTPPILEGSNIFYNIATTTCAVPVGCVEAYEESDWSNYFTTFVEI